MTVLGCAPAPSESAPPPAGNFANQPTGGGWTEVDDYGWPDTIPVPSGDVGADWFSEFVGANPTVGGMVERVTNEDGPVSPPNAHMTTYPAGDYNGDGVGTLSRGFPTAARVYVGFTVKWDSVYEHNTTSTKLIGIRGSGATTALLTFNLFSAFLVLFRGGTDVGNIGGAPPTLGVWHEIELIVDATDNSYSLWLNGTLRYSGNPASPWTGGWDSMQIESTMGGGAMTKARDSFRWVDHTRISYSAT